MKKIPLFVLSWLSFCRVNSAQEDNYQSWVSDPRYSLFPTLPIVAPNSQDEDCKAHSLLFLQGLRNKTKWAVQMWDSSAKTPNGVLSGSIFHFGNFDECLKIVAPFKVHYCLGHLFANVSLKFYDFQQIKEDSSWSSAWTYVAGSRLNPSKIPRDLLGWGLCLPASCKTSDIQNAINSHLVAISENFYNETTFQIHLDEKFCTEKDNYIEFTPGEIAFWVFVFSLIILTTSSTLMDFIFSKSETKPSKIYRMWMLFSVKQNFGTLVPLTKKQKGPLDVLHGIKFVSIVFIIYGHRIGIALSLSATNYDDVEDHFIKEHKMFFVHTDLVVDTFFFISGLLACWVMMGVLSKRFINPLYAIAVRIFRLAPLYFFVIWYQSTAAFRIGSGPLWNTLSKAETDYCVKNWWTNVLFISNYVNTEEMCMPHSWFLPCELHFFILATILVPIIIKHPKTGKILLGIALSLFIVAPAITIYIYKTEPLILFYYKFLIQPRKYELFNRLYITSHTRAAVYFIGMAVGLYLFYTKDSKKKISMKLTMCGILGWFAFMFAPMAYGSLYYDVEKNYNVTEAAVFGSLRRVSWGIAFAIFILAHRFGTIPLADSVFSSRAALFLSRLTYGIYLFHFDIVTADILKNRNPVSFSIHDDIISGLGDIFKAAAATIVLTFILEIPLKRFFREFLFSKKVENLEQDQSNTQNVFTIRL